MTHRIRLNLTTREFEVEGPEAFVEQHAARFEALLEEPTSQSAISIGSSNRVAPIGDESFGSVLQGSGVSTGTDRLLLAGWYVQGNSESRLFTTKEANELLKEQGIKLGNPAQAAANLQKAKYVFREKGKYRVSKLGEDRLLALKPE